MILDQYKNILKDIGYIMKKFKINKNLEDVNSIFIRFGMDKDNDVIAMICSLEEFFKGNKNRILIRVVYGKMHLMKNYKDYLRMSMFYNKDVGSLHIENLECSKSKKRKGHASFVLKNLENIICSVNDMALEKNQTLHKKYIPISKVSGLAFAYDKNIIKQDELKEFYKGCGFNFSDKNNFYKMIK